MTFLWPRCEQVKKHTKRPGGYLQWHAWADKKLKTHYQAQCPGCGLYVIWKRKDTGMSRQEETNRQEEVQRILSKRERLVASGVAQGKSDKIIAFELGVSPFTIRSQLRDIHKKLHCTNRTQVALKYHGLLPLNGADNEH